MKANVLLGCLLTVVGVAMSAESGQLATDDLSVFGSANFYGDVHIGWGTGEENWTNGLILYYDFNTNAGTYAIDSSGNNYTGTVSGATWTNSGISGGAYSFDGNDYISVGDRLDMTGSLTNMTVCIWVKFASEVNSDAHLISKSQIASPYTGWEVARTPLRNPFSALTGDGSSKVGAGWGGVEMTSNVWYFVCASFRAEPNYLETSLYLDGVIQETDSQSVSYPSLDNTTALTIGARDAGALWHVIGLIDEVRIYDRVLSDGEIGSLYAYQSGIESSLNVKDLVVDNELIQTGTGTNILMGPTGIGVTNPVGQLQVGGLLNVDGNIRLNNNWLSGDGDNEGVSVASDGTVTILKLEPQGDISMGTYINQP